MVELTDAQRACWNAHGYVLLRGFLSPAEVADITTWTETLAAWPETPGKWMKYFEQGPAGERLLCRVENFIDYHEAIAGFLRRPDLIALLSDLMGEPAMLFKEKVNFKLPGGAGFAPHQDAPAFTTFRQHYHVTMMVPVDPSTPANGCLEVVHDHNRSGTLPQEPDGTLSRAVVEQLEWRALPAEPGDLLLFDSYMPHRSGPNRTDRPRRAWYITYNRVSEGDRRLEYYAHKRKSFPPEVERDGWTPDPEAMRLYNLGNPIR
jgi:ectoine hydroxylase-related dioxygenase (phytanoyl-CoA dioxygenase family)